MFNDSGSKIKTLSAILFFLVAILSVVFACVLGFEYGHMEYPALFFGILIGGPLSGYISSLVLAGFGELIEDVASVRAYCKKVDGKLTVQNDSVKNQVTEKACWKCTCGRTNPSYTVQCTCGTNKWDVTSAK